MTSGDRSQSESGSRHQRWRIARWVLGVLVLVIVGTALGILYEREVRRNFRSVVPEKVYRSRQPTASNIENWTQKYGLATVINLRGESKREEYRSARAKAEQLGLNYFDHAMSGGRSPTKAELTGLVELLERAPAPVLLHCRAGIDRSGMASVLARMAFGGESYEDAAGELFDRLQYRRGREDDSVGSLFVAYEAYHEAAGTATGGWPEFRKWALEIYYPYYYHVSIVPPPELRMTTGQKLQVPLTITNRSVRAIPFGDEERRFRLTAILGTSVHQAPDATIHRTHWFDRGDLAPGETIELVYELSAPGPPGSYNVGFDMVEEDETWFARQGSPIGRSHVVVTSAEVEGD